MLVLQFLVTAHVKVENVMQVQVSLPPTIAAKDSMPLSRIQAL